ncbi:hypothetical protein JRQ81_013122 [Phrynocephalus forsythii]|uniref:Uncharacterized protein n=1 Tax=Phrynocephalus forsythii TaxID=171643 RepID=A0A9Q0XZJ9_9SAUR|nr:hypothetical protein JRQ81_013122 [Phrynocephalus forsythii]
MSRRRRRATHLAEMPGDAARTPSGKRRVSGGNEASLLNSLSTGSTSQQGKENPGLAGQKALPFFTSRSLQCRSCASGSFGETSRKVESTKELEKSEAMFAFKRLLVVMQWEAKDALSPNICGEIF